MIERIKRLLKTPKRIPFVILNHLSVVLPDKIFLSLKFKLMMGWWPNLRHPQTFNEKLQWLKIYDHNPLYTQLVDKYSVKEWVGNIIGKEYIIPTLAKWENAEEIETTNLPNQFVLKVTHAGGGNGIVLCRDKNIFNLAKAKENLSRALKINMYKNNREWPYKNVKPRIIAEKLLFEKDTPNDVLNDYKYYCFDGKVAFMLISSERANKHAKFDYYDTNFKHLPFKQGGDNFEGQIKKPQNFDLMIELAEKLSKDIPHVRVDFYEVDGKVYFGEMTFFDSSGFSPFEPKEWDYKWGNLIKLPKF